MKKGLSQRFCKRWDRVSYSSAFKSAGTGPSIRLWRKTYSSAFRSAGIRSTYSSAFKSAGIGLSPYGKSVTLFQRFWASYTSVFEKRRYRPPIATLFKALVLSRCNRISYTSVFKKRWYRLIYYSGS